MTRVALLRILLLQLCGSSGAQTLKCMEAGDVISDWLKRVS